MEMPTFRSIVDLARLAPSAHNTQPVRWTLSSEGAILISADLSRRLPVGDPHDRDLLVSCGAAVEATVLALAAIGQGANVEALSEPDVNGHRPIARIAPTGEPCPTDIALAKYIPHRLTHRLGFSPNEGHDLAILEHAGVTLVQDSAKITWISGQIDIASSRIMQDAKFRSELLSWMRLSEKDPRYFLDGLNTASLGMNRLTAWLTQPILGTALFSLLSRLGLGPALSGEAAISRTSTAIVLFHRPTDGPMVDAGRMFYRTWLKATSLGLAAWPAAALADDEMTAEQIKRKFGLPSNHTLFNTLRIGEAECATPPNTRLSTDDQIL